MEKIDLGNISLGGSSAPAPAPVPQAQRLANLPAAQVQNDIYFEPCEEAKACDMGEVVLAGQGCVLDLSMTLKNVCPGKRVALGVALMEVDCYQHEYPCGLKTMIIPSHGRSCCADIPVSNMRFIMPEGICDYGPIDPCGGQRHFVVRVDAHYLDSHSDDCGYPV